MEAPTDSAEVDTGNAVASTRVPEEETMNLTRAQLVERIMFAVDGYRFGEWSLADAAARITRLIEQPR